MVCARAGARLKNAPPGAYKTLPTTFYILPASSLPPPLFKPLLRFLDAGFGEDHFSRHCLDDARYFHGDFFADETDAVFHEEALVMV